MDQYCVVVCGLQAEASEDASAWQPVAAALKLDHADFERRVVAALPRIVRGHLDQTTAARIAQVLHAMHVDARVLPDDPQLTYIHRAGAICGPVPHSSLGDFIQPGESYRLHGDTDWQPWPEASSALTFEFDDFDDATSPHVPDDEPINAIASAHATEEPRDTTSDEGTAGADDQPPQALPTSPHAHDEAVGDISPDALPTSTDDEPHHAMPPPLMVPPAAQEDSLTERAGDPEAISPTMDAAESAHDDNLIDPPEEPSTPSDSDVSREVATEAAAPKRPLGGRILVLLVLVVLAIWAYRHWIADTRTEGLPATPTVIQPSEPVSGKSAATGRVLRGGDVMPTPVPAAAVAPATSTPAPATTSAAPTSSISAALPAGATMTPPAVASTAAPATTTAVAAGMLPAIAGSIMPARSAPAVATSVRPATTSRH